MLTADQIKAAPDLDIETVAVPEWGGEVGIRHLTRGERDKVERWVQSHPELGENQIPEGARSFVLALALCDAEGNRLFGDDDLETLQGKNGEVLERLWDVAAKKNGLTGRDAEQAEKN